MMLEATYKKEVIERILEQFPGAIVLKNDASYFLSIPDWLVLYKDRWAALEIKRSISSRVRPNQPYYVSLLNAMSYASFLYPQNEDEVLNELQQTFTPSR